MNPLQNPSPYPNSSPNPAQTPKTKPLSFDDVSKFFSLPLSDAADSLGVCASVLKKICLDNGLARWPYRKVLAGKSIEEIKKEAVTEKKKQLAKMPGIAGERGSELPNKTSSSAPDISKSRIASQPQGSKNLETGTVQNVYSSSLTKGMQSNPDEFKYGFPSVGLSTVSYRWWGNDRPDSNKKMQVSNSKSLQEKEQQSEAPDGENSENHAEKSNKDSQGTSSLSAVRRRAVKEGKAALKLGVYQGNGVNNLDWSKRAVLLQIFKSSLPNEWEYSS